ncbi:MAG: hypothetical protein ACXWZL_08530 [Mycobacterium sp.]
MVHAPRTGKTVEVVHDVFSQPYYAAQFALATRPGETPPQRSVRGNELGRKAASSPR